MLIYTTRSWPDILEFYQGLAQAHHWQIAPMLDLVAFTAASPYAPHLFPVTSMATLRIGRYPNFLAGDGELSIDFEGPAQEFVFTYQSHPLDTRRWTRHYPTHAGRSALERFLLSYARWFQRLR
jgi:hypothetical protein